MIWWDRLRAQIFFPPNKAVEIGEINEDYLKRTILVCKGKEQRQAWFEWIDKENATLNHLISLPAQSCKSCSTFWDPMDCSLPGSSIHGILQVRILKWVAMPTSRGPSRPRDGTLVSCITRGFFTTEPLGNPCMLIKIHNIKKEIAYGIPCINSSVQQIFVVLWTLHLLKVLLWNLWIQSLKK